MEILARSSQKFCLETSHREVKIIKNMYIRGTQDLFRETLVFRKHSSVVVKQKI